MLLVSRFLGRGGGKSRRVNRGSRPPHWAHPPWTVGLTPYLLQSLTFGQKNVPRGTLASKRTIAELKAVVSILTEQGFNPIEELVKLYRTGKMTVVTKEGATVDIDLPPGDRISILKILADYGYSKPRPTGAGEVGPITVNILRFGDNAPIRLAPAQLPAPCLEIPGADAAGPGSVRVAPKVRKGPVRDKPNRSGLTGAGGNVLAHVPDVSAGKEGDLDRVDEGRKEVP